MSKVLFCFAMVLASVAFAADNESINTLPVDGSNQPTSTFFQDLRLHLINEAADRDADHMQDFVVSGGAHTTAGTCTSANFATTARTSSGNRIVQALTAINYSTEGCNCANPGSDTGWVIASASSSDTLANFNRVGTTDLFVDCTSATKPSLPADSAWLMEVAILNAQINAVTLLANRVIESTETLANAVTVGTSAHWHFAPGGMVDCNSQNFTFNGSLTAGETQQIFTNCSTGEVRIGNIGHVYVDWWGPTIDDATADNGGVINAALRSLNPNQTEGDGGLGGTVWLGRGEYWTDSQINLVPSVNLYGVNRIGSSIRCDGNTLTDPCVQFVGDNAGVNNEAALEIKNLQITGLDTPNAGGVLLYFDDGGNITVQNVNVRSSNSICIQATTVTFGIQIIGGRTEACRTANIDLETTNATIINHDAAQSADFGVGVGTLLKLKGGPYTVHGGLYEGSSQAANCIELDGADGVNIVGLTLETCTATSIAASASSTNKNIRIENNRIGPAGATPRIDLQVSGNTCDGISVLNNRFSSDTGTIILDGSACSNIDYRGNQTDISSPTHVNGYTGTVEHVLQIGSSTADEQGILVDAIIQHKDASETTCATSLDASLGSVWNITTCGGATGLTSIANGYIRQRITITCTYGVGNTNFTIADQPDINLSAAFTCNDEDTIELITLDGTNWREVSRSDN